MQIKRYEGKNMTAALRRVKDELGPDAVILSARSLRKSGGIFGSSKTSGVEVTAAVDSGNAFAKKRGGSTSGAMTAAPVDAIGRYQSHAGRKSALKGSDASKTAALGLGGESRRAQPQAANNGSSSGMLKALHHQLLGQDVQRSIASALIEEIQRIPGIEGLFGRRQIREYLKDLLEEMGMGFHPVGAGSQAPKLIAFVGPPGVGKTATLAKLASRHAAAGKLKVALIAMDGYRIGAVEELRILADIIDVPVAVLNTPAALRATLKRFRKYDVVYLDTAGIGFHDQDRLTELQSALAKVKRKEVHLLLNATTRERDMAATIERFSSLPIACMGFTHLDECSTHGVLINIMSKFKLPLSILSNGQHIPEDLQNGSIDAILDWVLKDFEELENQIEKPQPKAESPRPQARVRSIYVANRNSDVYHERQCKWTRKIKPQNMVEFASITEAESQRYLPCRTCRPNHDALDDDAAFTRDRITLTNYR